MNLVGRFGVCVAIVIAAGFSAAEHAVAAPTTVPIQVGPAPYGNPNGSVDFPPAHCVAVVGEHTGRATITGSEKEGWGCPPMARAPWNIVWVNVSTSATGSAVLMNDSYSQAPQTTMTTGTGQVALLLLTNDGIYTPGFATFYVP